MTNDNCIFCKIKEGNIPAHKVYEDEKCFAIMDKFPGTEGQTLIIAKEHEPYLFNLDNETYTHLFEITKKIGKAINTTLNPKRTCILVEGFDVPHTHIRIHPTYGQGLVRNGDEANDEELKILAEKIKEKL
jgi:histidine triad (HIT) family protein